MREDSGDDLVYVSRVLDQVRRTRERGGWPICLYVADPPGKSLVQTYVGQRNADQRILCIEIPPSAQQKLNESYVPTLLLRVFGEEFAARREDAESKSMLLQLLIVQHNIDLIVFTDAHHLVTPTKQLPRSYEITWMKAFIKDLYPPIPTVITGNLALIEKIIASNAQMRSLFSRLLLPSERITQGVKNTTIGTKKA